MTLHTIVAALGGDLYHGGSRANIPAPGHSAHDRSISLWLTDGHVIIYSFGAADWRDARDDLRARGFIDTAGRLIGTIRHEGIRSDGYNPVGGRVIEALDGVVRQRLEDRRAAWEASGETVIAWVHSLPHGEKMGLLAELTAVSLDVCEARTTLIRKNARREAAELAALCHADIALHWTPDAPFLQPHSKALLLGMLETMGAADDRARALKKTELVDWVAEQAAARSWAPAALSLAAPTEEEVSPDLEGGPPSADDDDDGEGMEWRGSRRRALSGARPRPHCFAPVPAASLAAGRIRSHGLGSAAGPDLSARSAPRRAGGRPDLRCPDRDGDLCRRGPCGPVARAVADGPDAARTGPGPGR